VIYCYNYTCFRLSLFSDINISQGSVATLVRCGGRFISWRVTQWKNYENRPTSDEVIAKLKRGAFFETQCICRAPCINCKVFMLSCKLNSFFSTSDYHSTMDCTVTLYIESKHRWLLFCLYIWLLLSYDKVLEKPGVLESLNKFWNFCKEDDGNPVTAKLLRV